MADEPAEEAPAEPTEKGEARAFTPKKPTFQVTDPDLPRFDEQDPNRVVGVKATPDAKATRFQNLSPAVEVEERGEAQDEPYLQHGTSMRPTAVFGTYLGFAGISGLVAFLLAFYNQPAWTYYVGAVLSAAIILFLGISLIGVKSAAESVRVEVTRTVESKKVERGRLLRVRLSTEGSYFPSSLKALVTDQNAPGIRAIEPPTVEGVGDVVYKARPQATGEMKFTGVDLRLRSRNGLWVQDQSWRVTTPIEVSPSTLAVSWHATLSGYVPFHKDTPKDLIKIYREVEYEEQRDYMAGDRMKDVDWRRVAMTGHMTIRRKWVDPETTVLFAFDVGQSMLMDQAGFRNIDLAAEVSQELMRWALARNHEVGLVAFDEEKIVDHLRPSRARFQGQLVREHLELLCNHRHPDEWGEDGPPEIKIIGDPNNIRMGIQTAIKKVNTAGCTIFLFSDMQTINEESVHAFSKASESGLPLIHFFLPGPGMRPYKPGEAPDKKAFDMRGSDQARGMRDLLLARGAEFVEINPFPEETALFTEEELEQYRQDMIAVEEAAEVKAS